MPDEPVVPAEEQATADSTDYAKRYNDLRPQYDRTFAENQQLQQRLKELERYESDPTAFIELGKTKGWVEVEDQQPPPAGGDETLAQYQARLEAAEARLEAHDARVAAENAAAGEELFHSDLDTWAEAEGVKLSKADHNAIFGLLMKAPDPTQESTARQIFEAHVADKKADDEARRAEWEAERKRPRLPTPPTGGVTNTGAPKWSEMSEEAQNEYMAARAAGQL